MHSVANQSLAPPFGESSYELLAVEAPMGLYKSNSTTGKCHSFDFGIISVILHFLSGFLL